MPAPQFAPTVACVPSGAVLDPDPDGRPSPRASTGIAALEPALPAPAPGGPAGGGRPRCCQASEVATLPRGVRMSIPSWSRKGSYTSSTVSGASADRYSESAEAHRAAAKPAAGGLEDGPVEFVETELVHLEQLEAGPGHLPVDGAVPPHLGVVADPLQEPVGQAGSTPRALGDLVAAFLVESRPSTPRPSGAG